MTKFFTADQHLGHRNILRFCNRPFSSTSEMDEAIVLNHNEVAKPNDEVYILGDIAFRGSPGYIRSLISRLNGKLYLIQGNHDKLALKNEDLFQWIKPLYEFYIQDKTAHGGRRLVTLCHYSMRVWNKSHHGMKSSIHLFGHSHSGLNDTDTAASMDVGVDSAAKILGQYRPFSYEEVVAHIQGKVDE